MRIAKYFYNYQNCGNTGNSKLWHRGCCHKIGVSDEDYLTPLQTAVEVAQDKMDEIEKTGKSETVEKAKDISHLLKSYRTALREESKFQNDQFDTG